MSSETNPTGDDALVSEPSLEARLEAWRNEQYCVASQVIVLEDSLELDSSHRFTNVARTLTDATTPTYYGGVDVSFPAKESDPAVAVYVILSDHKKVVYRDHLYFNLEVPYVPSYLSFREIDPIQYLVQKQVSQEPSLTPAAILVDGNGILHPRGAGLACFLGVYTGIPTIGVGKSLYCEAGLWKELVHNGIDDSLEALSAELEEDAAWKHELQSNEERVLLVDKQCIDANDSVAHNTNMDREACMQEIPNNCSGIAMKLRGDNGRVLAAALLGHGGSVGCGVGGCGVGTRVPIYISVGHNISLDKAVQICASLSLARIPEPVRQADLIGRRLLRRNKKK
jgi:deoxyinosine 3'endonuclease (endonuclease V)